MRIYRLHLSDFSPKEALIFSSLLRLISGELHAQWQITTSTDQLDLTIHGVSKNYDVEIPKAWEAPAIRLSSPHFKDPDLVKPLPAEAALRANTLIRVLNDITLTSERSSTSWSSISEWTSAISLVETLPLLDEKAGTQLAMDVEHGVSIDLYFDAEGVRWSVRSPADIDLFPRQIALDRRYRVRLPTEAELTLRSVRFPLSSLLWLITLHRPTQDLLPSIDPNAWLSLSSWYDFGVYKTSAALIQLCVLMMQTERTVAELSTMSKLPNEQTLAFINACECVGFLKKRSADGRALVSRPVPNERPSNLFQRLRSALGLDLGVVPK